MGAFVTRRILLGILTVFIVVTFVFFFVRLLPGDPIYLMVNPEQLSGLTEEQFEHVRAQYGLDQPLPVQYVDWIGDLLQGDLGRSFQSEAPVSSMLAQRLPVTLHLGITAWILGSLIGIPMGILAAVRRATWWDTVSTFLANIGITAPVFWVAVILIYVFAIQLGWLPVMGYTSPFEDFWLSIRQMIMPVICLTVFGLASGARQTRSSMLETRHQDYVRTAIAKGLSEHNIIFRHMLKNALIPVVTLKGLGFTILFGGQVLIENVFAIPGMGRLMVNAVLASDFPLIIGSVLLTAVVVVIVNLIVDISYGWLDPRISYD